MHISLDGYIATPDGKLDWITWIDSGKWAENNDLAALVNELTDSNDTILMGRKMSREFLDHWEDIVDNKPDSPEFAFANKMVYTPKIIFSKTVSEIKGRNVRVENGDLVTAINALKAQEGKDIIAYGGASFVSSLIENNLIDEMHLFVNPTAIGEGLPIFRSRKAFKRTGSLAYENGIVVNSYVPIR